MNNRIFSTRNVLNLLHASHQLPAKLCTKLRRISCTSNISIDSLPAKVRYFIEEKASLCQPDNIHVCDGSEDENEFMINLMKRQGMIVPLPKYENW